jgi:hypothetical protein
MSTLTTLLFALAVGAPSTATDVTDKTTADGNVVEEIRALPVGGEEPKPDQGPTPLEPLPKAPGEGAKVKLNGYLVPGASFRYRPDALPRDQWSAGFGQTALGLILSGELSQFWRCGAEIVVGGAMLQALTGVSVVDRTGNGTVSGIESSSSSLAGESIEQLTVSFVPIPEVEVKLGQMRIPFTAQHMSPSTALMFPTRSSPNEAFLSGTDLGLLAEAHLPDQGVLSGLDLEAGIFNGTGKAAGEANARGLLYLLRLDATLFGKFPPGEADLTRGDLRIGVGAGMLYSPQQLFDGAGFNSLQQRDLRASISVRMALKGFYLQAEFLRRQTTDDLSSRPRIDTGAYGQASFYIPFTRPFGLAPIVRLGWVGADQSFYARETIWTEAGATIYLAEGDGRPDGLRLTVQYLGEWRLTDNERAQGAVAQVVYLF